MARGFFCKNVTVCDVDNYMDAMGDELDLILERDNKEEFIKLLKDDVNSFQIKIYRELILEQCVVSEAKDCTIYFLQTEFSGRPKNFDGIFQSLLNFFFLRWKDPDVLQTFIDCNPDFVTASCSPVAHFLPIQKHLLWSMNTDPLSKWCKGDSLIKLIIMLMTDTEMISKSKCLHLLAINTKDIDKVALGFYNAGDVKELAALLLFAYHTVFQPLKSVVLEEDFDSDKMVLDVNDVIHGDNYSDVLGLVRLFDKAGDKLSNFSMEKHVHICAAIIKVARVFKNAGLEITYKDVDLGDAYSLGLEEMQSIHTSLVGKYKEGDGPRFPSVYCYPPTINSHVEVRHYRLHPPTAYQSYSTAAECKQGWSRPSSRARGVAFLAMRLTRGIRFLRYAFA